MPDAEHVSCEIEKQNEGTEGNLPPAGEFSPAEVKKLIEVGATFVVNITAAWCHDCVDQKETWPEFEGKLKDSCIHVMSMQVYGPLIDKEKVFHSDEYQDLTTLLMNAPIGSNPLTSFDDSTLDRSTSVVGVEGENRFPVTFLIINGNLAAWKKEVKTTEGLSELAQEYIGLFTEAFRK